MNWLITLMLVPAIGAVAVALLPKDKPDLAKQVALGFSVATAVLVIAMALQFDPNSTEPFQFVTSTPWIESFGISFALGVDGIALVLIALAAVLVPVVILAGWNEADSLGCPDEGLLRPHARPRGVSWSASSRPPTCSCSTSSSRRC
jgi:NADH-quinone oxidoreductase subunit M